MPEYITAYSKNFSCSAKIHTCYKWLHRLPSNICCGAKQSCLQMMITGLWKQLEGISDSTARCMYFITLRMTTMFKALKSPPKNDSPSGSKIHSLDFTQFNPILCFLMQFPVHMMEENRDFCIVQGWNSLYSLFWSAPHVTTPNIPAFNTIWKEHSIYKILHSSHLKCKGNSWGELPLAK